MMLRCGIYFFQAKIEEDYSIFTASIERLDLMNMMICTRKVD